MSAIDFVQIRAPRDVRDLAEKLAIELDRGHARGMVTDPRRVRIYHKGWLIRWNTT